MCGLFDEHRLEIAGRGIAAPVKAFACQQRPAGSAFTGVALSNTLDNRTEAA